ncbi:MAG: helix-turn-helix domain-containing protein [Candidatus Marinimicrobia bacterium]|nr:helix-turn-helix domain-containing protein [Candidatus Neomarinimicrobiota bacterium]
MGARIKRIREDLGLSQDSFGDQLGVTRLTVSNYESGKRAASQEILYKISQLGDYDMNWLLTGRGQMHFQDVSVESDPDYEEFAANEAGDPGLQMLLNDENRKKYGITEDEATTLKGVLFRRKGKGTLEQWLRILWSIRELE